MPELRKDPTNGKWTIIAAERGKRPHDFVVKHEVKKSGECPFCYGNEAQTPPEVLAIGRESGMANTPGWSVRVVPNKFPALQPDAGRISESSDGSSIRPYEWMAGIGAHEVLIESPVHNGTFGTHSPEQMESVFRALIQRFEALKKDSRIKYIQFFKNVGRTAGASLEHTHCQLVALPVTPRSISDELAIAEEYKKRVGSCVYCDVVDMEIRNGTRIIEESERFVVFCPYASRFPYELRIIPRKHHAFFEEMGEDEIGDLARVMKYSIARLESSFEDLPYNLVLHTAPWDERLRDVSAYHWHIEILPRLAVAAGFELGTGIYINPTSPEFAAAQLKAAEVQVV